MNGFSITQVAEQLGIKVHTIRYWEKHVPLLTVQRDANGKRLYNRQDVYLLIRLKYFIEEKKYTLKGAGAMLIKEISEGSQNGGRTELLEIIKKLALQRDRLAQARDIVQEMPPLPKEKDK